MLILVMQGYIEDGSNGQVMVEQPKFYYKVVPLKMEKNDEVEIASVKFDTGASQVETSQLL